MADSDYINWDLAKAHDQRLAIVRVNASDLEKAKKRHAAGDVKPEQQSWFQRTIKVGSRLELHVMDQNMG